MSNKKKKAEFSKVLIILLALFFIINFEGILLFVCYMILTTQDTSCFNQLLVGFFGLMTAILTPSVAFYFWKAKNENAIKIKEEYAKLQDKHPGAQIDATLIESPQEYEDIQADDDTTEAEFINNIDLTDEGR